VIAAMSPFQWHVDYDSAHTDATKLYKTHLEASRMRISKTEFISCPSCGRTLFNLQGAEEGQNMFIFALFSTLGLMIILILETMTIRYN